MLGISNTDLRMARKQSIASTTSNRSAQPQAMYTDSPSSRCRDVKPQRPKLELKASSVLLHEEFLLENGSGDNRPPMPIKNFASSSTLHSHYDSHKVPLTISQQTSESSRRDLALRRGNPQVVRPSFKDRDHVGSSSSPRLMPAGEGRKLNKQRPKTSETQSNRADEPRPDTGYESVPSLKSLNHTPSKSTRSGRVSSVKPSANPRAMTGSTSKSLLEPLNPACVKVNVRRPRAGAKNWFDGLEEESSEEEAEGDLELQPHFFSGLENAFQHEQIKPPSDRSSIRADSQAFHLSNSGVSTPKQFLRSQSSTEASPRVAVLNAKASKTSLAQHSTRSQRTITTQRKPNTISSTDLTKNSFLNMSSDDETEDEQPASAPGPVRPPYVDQRPIRDSVAMSFHNDSAVEVGTAHQLMAAVSTSGAPHSRVRTLKVNRVSRPDQIKMPVPRRGSSLPLSSLQEQAEKQSMISQDRDDRIPSFPATPAESDATAYRMSISVFSDTDSVSSRRMMSVTRQEQSLLAAMRLKKAAMKHNMTNDKRLQTLRNLEQGTPRTPPIQHFNLSSESMANYRQPVQPCYGEEVRPVQQEAMSRASGTTFQTRTTGRQSHNTDTATPMNRLSLSSDSQSASPSLLSLNVRDRQSRDTYLSGTSPGAPPGHSRQRTESSHFSHVVELDKVPDHREDVTSQAYIQWPYKGWQMGIAH